MEHGRPFGVIAAALGCARDAPDERRATIANLISAHDSRDHGPLTVSSDPGLQFRVVDALCDLVESLAGDRPLVLALDDLQWADPSSLVTLGALARTALGMPVALIACCRPFPRPPAMLRLFESLEHAGLRRIELCHLGDGDVRDVVAEVVGATPGPGLLGVVAGASGNPLFVTELLNAIVEDGSLSTDGRACRGQRLGPATVSAVDHPGSAQLAPGRGDPGAQGRVLAGIDVLDHRARHGPGPAGHRRSSRPSRRSWPRGCSTSTGCCCGSATT